MSSPHGTAGTGSADPTMTSANTNSAHDACSASRASSSTRHGHDTTTATRSLSPPLPPLPSYANLEPTRSLSPPIDRTVRSLSPSPPLPSSPPQASIEPLHTLPPPMSLPPSAASSASSSSSSSSSSGASRPPLRPLPPLSAAASATGLVTPTTSAKPPLPPLPPPGSLPAASSTSSSSSSSPPPLPAATATTTTSSLNNPLAPSTLTSSNGLLSSLGTDEDTLVFNQPKQRKRSFSSPEVALIMMNAAKPLVVVDAFELVEYLGFATGEINQAQLPMQASSLRTSGHQHHHHHHHHHHHNRHNARIGSSQPAYPHVPLHQYQHGAVVVGSAGVRVLATATTTATSTTTSSSNITATASSGPSATSSDTSTSTSSSSSSTISSTSTAHLSRHQSPPPASSSSTPYAPAAPQAYTATVSALASPSSPPLSPPSSPPPPRSSVSSPPPRSLASISPPPAPLPGTSASHSIPMLSGATGAASPPPPPPPPPPPAGSGFIGSPHMAAVTLGEPCVPSERYGHTAVVDTRRPRMFVFGGNNLHEFNSDLLYYNFELRTWFMVRKPEEPPATQPGGVQQRIAWPQGRHFHTAVEYQGGMYIFGGKSNGYMNDLWRFDFDTMTWQEIFGDVRPNKRYGHSAVVYRGSMYIFGGYDDFGLKCNDLWQLDFGTNKWQRIQTIGCAPERFHHSAVVYQGSMYVFGGKDGLRDIQEYRFGSRTWAQVRTNGPDPEPRWGHTAVVARGKMWILGGCDSVINFNHFYPYHFNTSSWAKADNTGYNRRYFQTAVVYSGSMYVFGGKNIHNYAFNELHCHKFDTGKLRREPDTFIPDFRQLLYDTEWADVLFIFPLEGKDITAHRNILQARCPKFAELIDVVARHRESLNNAAAAAAASGDAATTTTTTTKDTPSNAERETSTPAPSRERRQKSPHRTRKDSSSMKRTDKKKRRRREISTKCHYSDEEQMYVISVTGVAFAVYRALLEYLYTGIYDSLSALEMMELLRLADLYELVHLKGVCRESLQSGICVKNAIELLQLSIECRVPELKNACIQYIISEHADADMQAGLKKADLEPELLKQIMLGISNYRIERQMAGL